MSAAVDVGPRERNLALAPTERLERLHQMTVLCEPIRVTAGQDTPEPARRLVPAAAP